MQSKQVHVQEIKRFSLHRKRRLGRMCLVGRTNRNAPSESSYWYSDGGVQSEPFATLRMAAHTDVMRAHLICCNALRVLFWLVGSLVVRIQQALKLSTEFSEMFMSACSVILKLLQTDADRLVVALLQPFAFKASTNISRRFRTNFLKLGCHCSPCNMLELSTARHVFCWSDGTRAHKMNSYRYW
jgi:hypothetical protein